MTLHNQPSTMWDRYTQYGQLMFKRAIGDSPEMESAKSAAKVIKPYIQPNDSILDVGCGVGHYLRSLKREIEVPFHYTGADATASYVALAQQAWANTANVQFKQANIFNLPFADNEFDVVMCNNVLLHLPSIQTPLNELTRVAKRLVLVRTLIGDRSFRIQDVQSRERCPDLFQGNADDLEFNADGEPTSAIWYNIYSKNYVQQVLMRRTDVKSVDIWEDTDFDANKINAEVGRDKAQHGVTQAIGRIQSNGYMLMPWGYVLIQK